MQETKNCWISFTYFI